MQCKRDGLGPIGEVVVGLGGAVKAIRQISPQALHHFIRFDQVDQLVGPSEAADPDKGFMARLMVLCSLPRLLLAWVSTEVVRTQSRELILGSSLAEFMRKLGISSDSGGSRGERTRLRNQMTASSFGRTSASPTSGCCGTAKSASVKTSLTKSSTTPYQLT